MLWGILLGWAQILWGQENCLELLERPLEQIQLLGQSDTSQVYEFHDFNRKSNVAGKKISDSNEDDDYMMASLQLEWEIMRKLNKENIAHIPKAYDRLNADVTLTDDDQTLPTMITLELLSKRTLAERVLEFICTQTSVDPDYEQFFLQYLFDTLIFLEKAARAMALVHQARVIHYDLKPMNLIFSTQGELFISDFGSAIDLDAPPRRGERGAIRSGGTQGFEAPEMKNWKTDTDYDPRTDIFSFGRVILFATLEDHHRITREYKLSWPNNHPQWKVVHDMLEELVYICTHNVKKRRPPNFNLIADNLAAIRNELIE